MPTCPVCKGRGFTVTASTILYEKEAEKCWQCNGRGA